MKYAKGGELVHLNFDLVSIKDLLIPSFSVQNSTVMEKAIKDI